MSELVEFICVDCGIHVSHFGPAEQCERCGICLFILELPEEDREEVREILARVGDTDSKGKFDA